MDTSRFIRASEYEWQIPPSGPMRVPAVIFASEELICGMDEKVHQQAVNVAALPGIQKASFAMPDAHWGYGFPIGGVAAFDPDEGGVVSAGGVGFDISCGVRTLLTGMRREEVEPRSGSHQDRSGLRKPSRIRCEVHSRQQAGPAGPESLPGQAAGAAARGGNRCRRRRTEV